ncbi:peptide deformylase [Devosia sp. WQ 349]|uniref:peptide deformylase n=1 Tax=Devosia sp. WQ 349K1 TaxID=2800329 RepID=UPI00190584FF|nr:peptide deformylase [Devosia sp. WQ 349K1]MBK1795804.1 peptide deformylase [Devosia sp. WQ 349K1]
MTKPAQILFYPDPRFAQRAAPRPVDAALIAIGETLKATAAEHRAYGLAAVHIGDVAPVVVVSFGPVEGRDYRLLYNPEVLSTSDEAELGTEGSVSLPGIEVEVVRTISCVIGYDDVAGVRQETALSGFEARVAMHEIDQMNGIFFLDKVSRLKRDAALRRFKKLQR